MGKPKGTWPKSDHEGATHHRGHYQPTLKEGLMTTFGWEVRLMTTFGQRDCDAIWQEQSYVLLQLQDFIILVDTPWQLFLLACLVGQCPPPLCRYIKFDL